MSCGPGNQVPVMDCSQACHSQLWVGGTGKGSWYVYQLERDFLQSVFHFWLVFLFIFILNYCVYLQSKY